MQRWQGLTLYGSAQSRLRVARGADTGGVHYCGLRVIRKPPSRPILTIDSLAVGRSGPVVNERGARDLTFQHPRLLRSDL